MVRRSVPVVLLVVLAGAVVAVAAGGTSLFVPPSVAEEGWLRAVRLSGAVAAVAGMVTLLVRGRQLRAEEERDFDATGSALAGAVTIMSVVALLAFLAPRVGFARDAGPEGGPGRRGGESGEARSGLTSLPPLPGAAGSARGSGRRNPRPGTGPARRSGQAVPGEAGGAPNAPVATALRKVGNALLLVVLLLAAVIGFRILTGARDDDDAEPEPPDEEGPVTAVDAEAGLLASLGDVAFEGRDPREQITIAYRRLLRALAAAGAPRAPQEAPHEYLFRALGPLGVRPEPMHRLAGLYVMAQFSEHLITERHRAGAVESLEAGLSDLRMRNAAAVPAGPVPEPVGA